MKGVRFVGHDYGSLHVKLFARFDLFYFELKSILFLRI